MWCHACIMLITCLHIVSRIQKSSHSFTKHVFLHNLFHISAKFQLCFFADMLPKLEEWNSCWQFRGVLDPPPTLPARWLHRAKIQRISQFIKGKQFWHVFLSFKPFLAKTRSQGFITEVHTVLKTSKITRLT